MKTIHIYIDGACRNNQASENLGAYAYKLIYGDKLKTFAQVVPNTTNNRMELLGAISAFEALNRPCEVSFCSDSKYVIDGLSKGWAEGWKKKGWKKGDGKPALNPELWDRLLSLCDKHEVEFVWVKGHAGHPENERCDQLATAFADSFN